MIISMFSSVLLQNHSHSVKNQTKIIIISCDKAMLFVDWIIYFHPQVIISNKDHYLVYIIGNIASLLLQLIWTRLWFSMNLEHSGSLTSCFTFHRLSFYRFPYFSHNEYFDHHEMFFDMELPWNESCCS